MSRRAEPQRSSPRSPGRHTATGALEPEDRFFRHLVCSMRNGVIAVHRDGTIALTNDEAYRIFAVSCPAHDTGRAFSDVFRERPEVVRTLSAAFELTTLPNRAELRLKE